MQRRPTEVSHGIDLEVTEASGSAGHQKEALCHGYCFSTWLLRAQGSIRDASKRQSVSTGVSPTETWHTNPPAGLSYFTQKATSDELSRLLPTSQGPGLGIL